MYGIARTLFLVCLLGLGSFLIHSDTYRLVLHPVQRMVERVREMAEDPLMLAAARSNLPGHSSNSSSGAGGALAASGNSGGGEGRGGAGKKHSQTAAEGGTWVQHYDSQQPKSGRASGSSNADAGSPSSGECGSATKASKTRFWPAVRIHAVAEDTAAEEGQTQLQLQQQQPRLSGTQMVAAQARRLSAGLATGLSVAGRAAGRLRNRLLVQADAMKRLLVSDVCEDEAAQGQYETRLLEQSIYKICALLAVGFGDAGAEVIAENIKKEGDLNPCMPGKKAVSHGGGAWQW